MKTRRYCYARDGKTVLRGQKFDWVHVYPGAPVPPLRDGSFNFLLWEILQQHPNHLLLSRYHPGCLDMLNGEATQVVYIMYKDRLKWRHQIKCLLTGRRHYTGEDFVDEACKCIGEIDVKNIIVWGPIAPLMRLRRAFPDKNITFAQRYFEVAGTSTEYYGYYSYCDYLLVQSPGTTRFVFEQQYSIRPTVIVIPNGVDLETFKPVSQEDKQHLRERMGLPLDKNIVFFPSKLAPHKGTGYLCNWIRYSREVLPDVYFVVAGGTHHRYEVAVRDLLRVLNNSDNVRWLGPVHHDEMARWYQSSDLSLMPGVYREGMSMAALESLACGLPVIATDIGIYPEIIFHEYNGFLVRKEALFREGLQAIRTLSENVELRHQLSRNARAYAEKCLDRRRCLENFGAYFEGRFLDIEGDLSP